MCTHKKHKIVFSNLMPPPCGSSHDKLYCGWPIAIVCLTFLILLILILRANDGVFVFTMDDAYVHFEQARNLLFGHYGLHRGEFSAPCSSILWPIILAPLTLFPSFIWVVLFLNLSIVIATIQLQFYIVAPIFTENKMRLPLQKKLLAYLLLVALILIPGLIPLLFSGMEYGCQVFFIHLVLWGLIKERREKCVPVYLMPSLILCPLIRYESLSLVLPVLIYLILRGYRIRALWTGLVISVLLLLFSVFLYVHDVGLLPTSIIAIKMHHFGPNVGILKITLINFFRNTTNLFSLPIIFLLYCMIPPIYTKRYRSHRWIAVIITTAVLLHFVFGDIGFHFKHYAYLLSALVIGTIYIYTPDLIHLMDKKRKGLFLSGTGLLLFLLSLFPLIKTGFIPTAANIIYRQPYQLHRLITEFYQHPVGLNDLGLVSYKNDQYILDLCGHGSKQVLDCFRKPNNILCINALVEKKNIHLIMITNAWFWNVPPEWIKIGEYHRGPDPVIVEKLFGDKFNHVDFYVTQKRYIHEAVHAITRFRLTLPATAYFRFTPYILNIYD